MTQGLKPGPTVAAVLDKGVSTARRKLAGSLPFTGEEIAALAAFLRADPGEWLKESK